VFNENKRRKYTQEFKEEAVKLVTEQGYQITEATRNLGVNENMLGRFVDAEKKAYPIVLICGLCHQLADKWFRLAL